MNTNIPIYRAKKIDNDDYVIFESYFKTEETLHDKEAYKAIIKIIQDTVSGWSGIVNIPITQIIDPSTLSIHFKDMLASDSDRLLQNGEKDLRIFASLSEDGKGGDLLKSHTGKIARLIYKENTMQWDIYSVTFRKELQFGLCSSGHLKLSKITGIKQ